MIGPQPCKHIHTFLYEITGISKYHKSESRTDIHMCVMCVTALYTNRLIVLAVLLFYDNPHNTGAANSEPAGSTRYRKLLH